MKRSTRYGERDYAFGQLMLTHRNALGLTQEGLAKLLGVTRRAVSEWEAGSSYPKNQHLKSFITLGVRQHIFSPPGDEERKIHTLWQFAHQKVLLDEQWLAALLAPATIPFPDGSLQPAAEVEPQSSVIPPPAPQSQVDWGDALAIPTFYGREQELARLRRWILPGQCRVVSVLGLGGIGKSALVVQVMHQVAEHFEVVLFRSLRNAPSCEMLLDDCLQVLSPQMLRLLPTSLEQRIDYLMTQLRGRRVLLALDNLETLLEEKETRGHFRPDFEGYHTLLRRIAETEHQGCVLLTSREKPAALRALEGPLAPVRSLRLAGLDRTACEHVFAEKHVGGLPHEQAQLAALYAGNPLALKMVTETIADLFGGEISQFLTAGTVLFGSILDLLAEQFVRLAPLEQSVLRWLAIAREPVTMDELRAMLVVPLPHAQVLEAMDSLRRRSFIERGQRQGSFTLQSVVLEYGTEVVITEMVSELQQQQPGHLMAYGLEQASAREVVRQTQRRLLVAPILLQLSHTLQGRSNVEERLLALLHQLRARTSDAQGYGPANLIALLHELRGDLRGLDLSHLAIRDAYLQGVEMQDASLEGATLCKATFTETLDAIWAVAISRKGALWAAGSKRGEVWVWRERGKTLHLIWQAHTDTTYTLAFSPDERTLASGGFDGTVKLWDLEQGALRWAGWHTHGMVRVAFSSDGSLLASGGEDGTIRVWDAVSGSNVQTLVDQGNPIHPVSWSPTSHLLASGSSDGTIALWQMSTTQPPTCGEILTGHANWVVALAFAPDGRTLASASWDHTIRLWDVASGHALQTLTGHTNRVQCVVWSPDGRTIASAGFDEVIWVWDVEKGHYRAVLHGHSSIVHALAFTPDSRTLLSGSDDGTLRVWDVESGGCMWIVEGYARFYPDLAWSPNGRWLASVGSDLLVTLWDVERGMPSRVLRGHSWTVLGITWSADGQLLATAGRDSTVRLWEPSKETCLQVLRDPDYDDTLFYDVAWSPDGQWLASGSYMRGVLVWAMDTRTCLWVGRQHQAKIFRVAWSPDSTRLASCGNDGSIYLWDAANGNLLKRFQALHGGVRDVEWSPDGRQLASSGGGSDDGEVLVWDAASGEIVSAFPDHMGKVCAVTWSPNGKIVISGNSEGSIRWWEVPSGKCLATRTAHQGIVQSLQVNADGSTLASGGDDSAIQLWGVESTELLQTLRQDRPYERLNIARTKGLTEAQRSTLHALGATEA